MTTKASQVQDDDEEVEIEIRHATPTTHPMDNNDGGDANGLPDVVPHSPADSHNHHQKMTGGGGNFFSFAPRSTAFDADEDVPEGPATMRSRVTNFLRLPNQAIKETWSRLDLDLPEEFKENFMEIIAVDLEQESIGECRDGKYCKYIYETLFSSTTKKGRVAGVVLLLMIATSVLLAVVDSVHQIRKDYGEIIYGVELFFTGVFSIEYILRVYCLARPRDYVWSAMGIVDISSIIPTVVTLFVHSARPLADLATLRIFRVIRVFRVLRLVRFVDAASALKDNIDANKLRVAVFMFFVFSMIIVIGCAMYLIEGDEHGFTNIPVSLYWAVVTLTTVGYGDIAPGTVPGRLLAAVVMFAGYGVIACPLVLNTQTEEEALRLNCECPRCYRKLHQDDANFCRHCGSALRLPDKKQRRLRKKASKMADEMTVAAGGGGINPSSNGETETEARSRSLEPPRAREIPTGAESSL